MATKYEEGSYFDLAQHNTTQVVVYIIIFLAGFILTFVVVPPFLEFVFTKFLNGKVYFGGELVDYSIEIKGAERETSYLFAWAVDIYTKTPQEARYWFNPFLSLIIPAVTIGLGMSVFLSGLIPKNIGLMRQKIEREIAIVLDRICLAKYGYHGEDEKREIVDSLLNADMRDLHDFVELWGMSLEDIKALHRALIWQHSSMLGRIFRLHNGFSMYMRFYFTVIYSNGVLGFVYIGAAVLIIIIGLRGLKFIPAAQPSLVLFALGLEFSLLIIYAFTLMYARQEDETDQDRTLSAGRNLLMNGDLGSSKEVEQLLRVFIKTDTKDKEQE